MSPKEWRDSARRVDESGRLAQARGAIGPLRSSSGTTAGLTPGSAAVSVWVERRKRDDDGGAGRQVHDLMRPGVRELDDAMGCRG
jgi:hypothetical protein